MTLTNSTPFAVNYKAYEGISNSYGISSATVVPAGLRTVATSGHVGLRDDGTLPDDLEAEMEVAFENVEKAILAVSPNLTSEEVWKSVYQVNTYHVGEESSAILFNKMMPKFLKSHRPAWTAVSVAGLVVGSFEIAVFAAIQ